MISFAQNFEDVMLYRIFRGLTNGFYIDVGAADPVHHSVTKWFYDLGWSGINIEPRATFFEALQRDRKRDLNLNCGAGAVSGVAMFLEMNLTHEWSSFDEAVRAAAATHGETIVEQTIPILTLDEIIEKYAAGRTIDFLKIDVEGWERQVLTGLDLTRHRPTIIVIEATLQGRAEPNSTEWQHILVNAHYDQVYFDGLNKFFIKNERSELAKYFAVPPNVFDEYKPAQLEEVYKHLRISEADRAARLEIIKALEQELVATNERLLALEKERDGLEKERDGLEKERDRMLKYRIISLWSRLTKRRPTEHR